MSWKYVRAVFDFVTHEEGELPLQEGDVLLVHKEIDSNWLRGCLYGQYGTFPKNFVERVALPQSSPGQKVFTAEKSFVAQEGGDLGFSRGDIILGLQPIDQNWWKGSHDNQTGMFPLTHVREIEVIVTGVTAPPELKQSESIDVGDLHKIKAMARAIHDLTAQLDDEIGFNVGDFIDIYEVQESDFAIGHCKGKVGSFPLAFVEVLEGNLEEIQSPQPKEERRHSKFDWWKDAPDPATNKGCEASWNTEVARQSVCEVYAAPKPRAVVEPMQKVVPDQSSTLYSSSNGVGEPVPAVSYLPPSSHPYPEASGGYDINRHSGSYNQENTRSFDSSITPYGKTLFPFVAENHNELSLFDNEIVTLVRHIDDQWLEGEVDGKTGIFPASYVEIIVDCPYDFQASVSSEPALPETPPVAGPTDVVSNLYQTPSTDLGDQACSSQREVWARVIHDFEPQTDKDLGLRLGQTVTIICDIDENWVEAQSSDGRLGICPRKFLEVVESEAVGYESSHLYDAPRADSPHVYDKPAALLNGYISEQTVPVLRQTSVSHDPVPHFEETIEKEASTTPILRQKPQLKPKPSLKPKPGALGARSKSMGGEVPAIQPSPAPSPTPFQNSPIPSPVPSLTPQPSPSAATATPPPIPERQQLPSRSGAAPQRPSSAPKRSSMPVKSVSIDSSLNDIIREELHSAKKEAISRVGSVTFGPSSTVTYNAEAPASRSSYVPLSQVPVQSATQPPAIPHRRSHAVGQSRFFLESEKSDDSPSRPSPPPAVTRGNAPPRPLPPSRSLSSDSSSVSSEQRPRPVPQRPAPPRPSNIAGIASGKRPARPGDLIEFSPERQTAGEEDVFGDGTEEVVRDLQRRLQEAENDLTRCRGQKKELEAQLSGAMDAERPDMEDNLGFYQANIDGLTREIMQVKDVLREMQAGGTISSEELNQQRALQEAARREAAERDAAERREKQRGQRQKVLHELLQTEQDYLRSMCLCQETFIGGDSEKRPPELDIDALFFNLDEVMELSQTLLSSLEAATAGKEFDDQVIGTCFIELSEEMKRVYAPYCRNHDDAIELIEKYEKDDDLVQAYLSHKLDQMKMQTTVFDLGSILIKPVQRILKYPLLINELIKSTEDAHPDKQPLLEAINAMTDVATAINEFKRRKDLVNKYKKQEDAKMSDKIQRLTVHSINKKLYRLSQKMVGIQTVDEEFSKEERKFKFLESVVRILVRDVSCYVEQLQDLVSAQEAVANDISDYYGDRSSEQEVEQFCKVHNQIATHHSYRFKQHVEEAVISPLNRLLMLLQGPAKVMKKRYDKLLDYDNLSSRVRNLSTSDQLVKSVKDEVSAAFNTYDALNSQLLDELPKLYTLAMDILTRCTAQLTTAQRDFHQQALQEMYHMLALTLVMGEKDASFVDTFNIAHMAAVEKLSDLSFIPKTFNPRMEERKLEDRRTSRSGRRSDGKQDAECEQTDSQRVYVRTQFAPDRIYTVHTSAPFEQPMGLAVTAGVVVGVIKEGDPMGNKERWFVDTGAAKGFVLKKFLSLGAPANSPSADLLSFSSAATNVASAREKSPLPPDLMDLDPTAFQQPAQSEKSLKSGGSTWFSFDDYADTELLSPDSCSPQMEKSSHSPNQSQSSPQSSQAGAITEKISDNDIYQAVYAFTARTESEVSLHESQLVRVISTKDLEGNSDWWLVEAYGQRGYAPANYLYEVKS